MVANWLSGEYTSACPMGSFVTLFTTVPWILLDISSGLRFCAENFGVAPAHHKIDIARTSTLRLRRCRIRSSSRKLSSVFKDDAPILYYIIARSWTPLIVWMQGRSAKRSILTVFGDFRWKTQTGAPR